MKTLSVKQPWAWLILAGYKPVENRKWATRFRGRFLIHAGLTVDKQALSWARMHFADLPAVLPTGAIVGEADLTGCRAINIDDPSTLQSDWDEGPWGFDLANVEKYADPIPYKGALGFFEVDLAAAKLKVTP